jgi:glutamine amidotransferase
LTARVRDIEAADGVVLPGVGAFGRCMEALRSTGLDALAVAAGTSGVPFLGICIGMQLLYEASEESPDVSGLCLLPGEIRRLPEGVKRPQMQWNRLELRRPSVLTTGLGERPWVYFVHSYVAPDGPEVVATCDYGEQVTALVERDRLWAAQFHPEKSGAVGLAVLANFVAECTPGRC